MNQSNASMTVIGAGSYGTALAITLARNGHQVVLWGHDPKHIATLSTIAATSRSFLMCLFLTHCAWKVICHCAGRQS
jgi:glycerol-3-phosphate dehydrogenase